MFFKKRRQQVPRLFFRDVVDENEEDYQDYHRRLAMLFKPWRMEDEKPADMDYDKWFEQYFDQLHPQAQQDIQKLIRNLQNLRKDDLERKQRMDLIMAARSAAGIEDQVEDALEVQERIVDVGQHEKNVDGLNGGQSNLFKMVTGRIDDQALGKEVDPIRIFCSGTAGCGKSYLIDRLADDVTIKHCKTEDSGLRPAVLIAAPTGLAAISVKGDTIHNLFGIEVQHGRDKTFRALPDRSKEQKRALFSNVKLVIIDEISMCSAITLQKIHLRLQEIRGNNEYFGGVNLCVFGDLMQLPPVMAPRVFSVLQNVRSIFHSIEANVSIWRTFDYQELTENMRQKDDLDFANMMGRCRVGALTEDDIKAFEGQIIPNAHGKEATIDEGVQHYLALMESDPTVMALFPTIAEVDQFNETVMEKKNMDTVTIHCREEIILSTAEDIRSLEKRRKNPISRIYQETRMTILKNKARKTALAKKKKREMLDREAAGLSAKLKLAVGGRVMLRRNVNRRQGLVNGATGVLRRIQWVGDNVEMLDIEFDRIPGKTISIQRDVAAYDVSLHERRRRSQFPVCMAFAATIHKCQGLTLRNALVSTKAAFEKGQLFVALSRVTNLKSLHLMDFVPSKITVDIRSLMEYNRLRKSIGLPEFAIPTSNNDVAGEEGNKKLRKSTKRKSTSAAVQIIREEPQRPIKKAARRVSVPPGIQFPGNLRLHNEANQCFANSYAQLIRRCFLEFVDNELGVDRGTVIWQELRRIITTLDDPTNNMHPFLELFVTYSDIPGMENYDDGEQHDAVELLHQSSSGPWLPACIQRAMKLDVINQTRCLTPGCTETRNEINPCHFIGILSSPIQRSFTRALEETSRREINRELRCDTCGGVGGTKEQHQFYQVNESTQFLAVEVNHFDYDRTNLGHRVSNPVEAPPNDGFEYQGARWRPIAAIWHQGGTPSSGHYKCYSRQQDGTWLIHSDDKIEPCSSLPPVLELIRYIIFERVDVVPDGLHGVAMEIDTPPSSPQRGSLSISSISSPAAVYPTNFPIVRLRNPLAPPAQFPRSVRYLQEDMFDVKADCLINAANNQLIPGEGIDGAMRRRAGQGLTAETSTYMNQRRNKAIPPGSAVLTGAHDLTSDGYKFIVHTAAPKLSSKRAKPSLQQMVEYISCLYNSFVKADEAGAESIVTAVIGSGIYNWSKELATALSLQAASLFLEINSQSTLQNITVVEKEFRTYNQNRNKCLGGKKELKVGTGTTDLLESKIETKDVQEQLQKTSEKFKKNLENQK